MAASLASLGIPIEFGSVLHAAREIGMDVTSLGEFCGHETWVERSEIWGRIMREVRLAGFPIRVGQMISIAETGPLGLVAKVAPDLRSAFERLIRYHHILTGTSVGRLRDDVARGTTILEQLALTETDLARRARSEMLAASTFKFARDISGGLGRPRRVCFRHAGPRDLREHEAFFDCEVHFGAGYSGLEFDRDTLALPLPGADAELSRFLLEHLRAIAGDPPAAAASLEARVEEAIRGRLGSQTLEMAAVAQELGMSARTLSRRLLEHRNSYHEILDRVRCELADELLGDPERSVLDAALLLGFSGAGAFNRAYVRWTGRTPGSRRRGA